MTPGNQTSEHKIAWVGPLISVLIMGLGALASTYTGTWYGMAAAALVSALKTALEHDYITSRRDVKVADLAARAAVARVLPDPQ